MLWDSLIQWFDASARATVASLKELIMNQSLTASPPDVLSIKADIHSHHCSVGPKRCMLNYPSLFREPWTWIARRAPHHAWLTVFPFHDQGFHLNKREFWDAIHFRYGWTLLNIVCVVNLFPLTMLWFAAMADSHLCVIMKLETLQQSCLIVYVMMLLLNHHWNHLHLSMLFQPLPTGKMMPELIYMLVGSGVVSKVSFFV